MTKAWQKRLIGRARSIPLRLEALEPRLLLNGTISGTIKDSATSAALSSVTVTLYDNPSNPSDGGSDAWYQVAETASNGSGIYTFSGVSSAYSYRLNIVNGTLSGGKTYLGTDIYNVAVVDNQTTTENAPLVQAGYIYGYVYDNNSKPLANALVGSEVSWISGNNNNNSNNNLQQVETNASGEYELYVAPTANAFYPLEVYSASESNGEGGTTYFAPQIAPGLYAASVGGTAGPNFTLAVGGTFEAKITDFGGNPIPNYGGVELDALLPNGVWRDQNIGADSNGNLVVTGVPTGTTLWLSMDNFGPNTMNNQSGPVYYAEGNVSINVGEVAAGATLNFGNVEVPQSSTVSGVLKNGSGSPISGVEMSLTGYDIFGGAVSYGPDGDDDGPVTASNGDYTFEGVPPGTYTLSVTTSGYNTYTSSQPLYVESDQPTTAPTIELTTAASSGSATFSGTISNFSTVAPKNAGGVVLPFDVNQKNYEHFGLPDQLQVVAYPTGDWSYSDPGSNFTGKGNVADGYTNYFVTSSSPAAGSFSGNVDAGAQTLTAIRQNGTDLATGSSSILISAPLNETITSGENLPGLSFSIPIGTADVQGTLSFPSGYTPEFSFKNQGFGGALVYLYQGSSTTPCALGWVGPTGQYVLKDLAAGTYTLDAYTPSMNEYVASSFTVSAGQNVTKNVTFTEAADTTAPGANLYAQPRMPTASQAVTFEVTYWDNVSVNFSTLGNSNIVVSGPNSFSEPATFLSASPSANGPYITATYEVAAPAGGWTSADNGAYKVNMQANQVKDTSGNAVAAGSLGQFGIDVLATYALQPLGSFSGSTGQNPASSSLVEDASGNLYGTTDAGGADGDGGVFEIAVGSDTISLIASFNGTDGQNPEAGLVNGGNGYLYGTASSGGASGDGTVFKMSLTTDAITPIASFNGSANGSNPQTALVMDTKGDLYGATSSGGVNGDGTVFEIAAGSSVITTVAPFGLGGAGPAGNLMIDGNGDLYGTTLRSGTASTVFEIVAGTHTMTTLARIYNINGAASGLCMDSNGDLFGVTETGGPVYSGGAVYEVVAGSGTATPIAAFNGTNGSAPQGSLVMDGAGDLFGTTSSGGADGDGTVFEIPVGGGTVVTLMSFNGNNGSSPQAQLLLLAGGALYGTANSGGANDDGAAFELYPSTPTHVGFVQEPTGAQPGATITPPVTAAVEDAKDNVITTDSSSITLTISSGTLNGTPSQPAVSGLATFDDLSVPNYGTYTLQAADSNSSLTAGVSSSFGITPPIPAYNLVTLASQGSDGSLVQDSSGNLYETTATGGTYGDGSIVEIQRGTNTVITLASFSGINGDDPWAGLVMDGSGNLYGTTYAGGEYGYGVVFEWVAATGTLTPLASFGEELGILPTVAGLSGTNGGNPAAGLVMDGSGNLFGTTLIGGADGDGEVFEVVADSNQITVAASFDGANGSNPQSALVMDSGGNLYGTTYAGGADSDGTIFELDEGSGTIITLASFNGTNGAGPLAGLVMDGQGDLYGTTSAGGASGDGVLFELAAGSGTINPLASFSSANGYDPQSPLLLDSYGSLYGTTSQGGSGGNGTVFELPAGSDTVTNLASFGAGYGSSSCAGLIMDGSGNLYGTTTGTVFELSPATIQAAKLAFGQQPTGTASGVTISPPVVVDVEDADGNIVANDDSTVTLTIASGPAGGSLEGTYTLSDVNGVATFNDFSLSLAGTYTLKASDGSLASATSGSFIITATPAKLAFHQQPTAAAPGGLISPAVVVYVEDAGNNLCTNDDSMVTLTINTGTLNGTTEVQAAGGVATFSDLWINSTGAYRLQATDGALSSANSAYFDIVNEAAKLAFTEQPAGSAAGANIPVTVTVENPNGSTDTSDGSVVSVTLDSGPAWHATAVDGVATFSGVSVTQVGSYTLQASDSADGLTGPTSGSFNITPATGHQLLFTTQPANGVAGQTLAPVQVTVEDKYGNIETGDSSTSVVLTDAGSTLTGATTETVSSGVATFSGISVTKAGSDHLYAADDAYSLSGFTSNSFNVAPAAPSQLVFIAQPAPSILDEIISPPVTVDVEDAFGNLVSSDHSSVTVAIGSGSSGSGSLYGILTVQAAGGVAAFSTLSVSATGTYTLQATDAALTPATSESFDVTGALHLVFTQQPTNTVAGATITPSLTVDIESEDDAVVTTDNNSVTLAIAPGGTGSGTLIGTVTVQAASGEAAFGSLSIDGAGAYVLTASDAADDLSGFGSNGFVISPASPDKLAFAAQPSTGTAGTALAEVDVVIEDQFGNVETGDNNTVSLNDTLGGLVGTPVSVAASSGVAQFTGLTLDNAGADKLVAADSADAATLSAGSFASGSINISPATAFQLVFTAQPPSTATAGTALSEVDVTIEDQYGNVETADNNAVTLTDTLGGLVGTPVSVTASSGVAEFTGLTLHKAGADKLVAADSTDGLSDFQSSSVTVSPASAYKLVFTTQPTTGTAGTALTEVDVAIEDQYGNVETTDNSTVSLTDTSGTLAGTPVSVAASSGVAKFIGDLTVTKAGSDTLNATDSTDAATLSAGSFASGSITISPASAYKLVFTTQPTTGAAGTQLGAVDVTIEDKYGNVETSDHNTVSLTDESGTLIGSPVSVAAAGGVAAFSGDLKVTKAGTDYLYAVDTGDAATLSAPSFASGGIAISPAAASQLVITAPPTNVLAGSTMSPAVTVAEEDTYGNVETGDSSSSVSLTLSSGTFNGGTPSEHVSGGVATFSNLSIPAASAGILTLTAADGSLTATSADFSVTAVGLAGNWQLGGALSNGTFATDGRGGVISGSVQNNGGALLTLTGGNYAVNSQGVITMTCEDASDWAYTWTGSVNAAHDVVTFAQTPLQDITNQAVMVLNSGSFSNADLSGSWAFDAADGIYGSLTFDGKGDITGGNWVSQPNATSGGFLKGSNYTVSAGGMVTVTLYIPDKSSASGHDTVVWNGALNASKDLFAGDAAVSSDLEKPTLVTMTKHTGTFALSDMYGTWNITADEMTGSLAFNGAGKITGGSFSNSGGEASVLSGSTYTVSSAGLVTANLLISSSSGTQTAKLTGALDSTMDALTMDTLNSKASSDKDYFVILTDPSPTDLVASVSGGTLLKINPAIPGNKGSVSVLVTNEGQVPAGGSAAINLYLCTSATETTGGTLLGALTKQTLNLAYDKSATYTFSSIQLPANLPYGTYYLRADVTSTLANPAESPQGFSAFFAAVPVVWEFGTVGALKGVVLHLTAADGTVAAFSLSTAGTGDVTVQGGQWDLGVTGSTATSALTITTTKSTISASGQISLDDITVAGPLATFSGAGVNLTGAMSVSGPVTTLTLNNLSNDGGITLGGAAASKTALTFDQVADESLTSGNTISSLTAASWADSDGDGDTITAPGLTTATIKKGELAATLDIYGGAGIGTLSVTGGSIIGDISAALIGTVTVSGGSLVGDIADWGGLTTLKVSGGGVSGNVSATREGTISVTGGNVSGDITSTATALALGKLTGIGSLSITGGDLTGDVASSGNVGTISVTRNAASGLGGNVAGALNLGGGLLSLTLTGGNLGGSLYVGGALGILTLNKSAGNGGNISAGVGVTGGTIGTLSVGGNFNGASGGGIAVNAATITSLKVAGSMDYTTLTLSGPSGASTTPAMGAMSVAGTMNDSQLLADGNITSVTLGAMDNSDVFAGVASAGLPAEAADFSSELDGIGTFTISGGSTAAASFSNSNIAAWTLGTVNVGYPDDSANGVACYTYGSLSYHVGTTTKSWKKTDPSATLPGSGVVVLVT